LNTLTLDLIASTLTMTPLNCVIRIIRQMCPTSTPVVVQF
jgi:hypothetical protein